jgi:uncharacterized membrane protein
MLLVLLCVATLIYFVGHMAGRINVDTVVELVSEDVRGRASEAPIPTRPEVRTRGPSRARRRS